MLVDVWGTISLDGIKDYEETHGQTGGVTGPEPSPAIARFANVCEPTLPGRTQFTVRAWRLMTPTFPGTQQKPLPSMPLYMLHAVLPQRGAPSTAPTQTLLVAQQGETSEFFGGKQKSDDGQ